MLSSSPEEESLAASRNRSESVVRIWRSVSPPSRSFSTTATCAIASAAMRDVTSTKMVRTTPLLSDSTSSSRSEDTWSSSSRSSTASSSDGRSEEHTSELQSRFDLVCRLLLEKKKKKKKYK